MRLSVSCYDQLVYSFNPRICKRCDFYWFRVRASIVVSIHASVKDATAAILNTKRFELVSIHASVKDATKDDITFIEFLLFQSTHL